MYLVTQYRANNLLRLEDLCLMQIKNSIPDKKVGEPER